MERDRVAVSAVVAVAAWVLEPGRELDPDGVAVLVVVRIAWAEVYRRRACFQPQIRITPKRRAKRNTKARWCCGALLVRMVECAT